MAFSSSLRGKIALATLSKDRRRRGVKVARLGSGFRRDRSREVYLPNVH